MRWGCLGPVVYGDHVVLDFIAVVAAFAMQPFPMLPPSTGVLSTPFFQAVLGAWNCSLVASSTLEVALAASCWRDHKGLRISPLYPPNSDALERRAVLPRPDEVPPFEVL